MKKNTTNKKQFIGTVISDKMDKTVIVETSRKFPHPKYKKFIKRSKKYYAHDPKNNCENGDTVLISESKPLSKLKKYLEFKLIFMVLILVKVYRNLMTIAIFHIIGRRVFFQ